MVPCPPYLTRHGLLTGRTIRWGVVYHWLHRWRVTTLLTTVSMTTSCSTHARDRSAYTPNSVQSDGMLSGSKSLKKYYVSQSSHSICGYYNYRTPILILTCNSKSKRFQCFGLLLFSYILVCVCMIINRMECILRGVPFLYTCSGKKSNGRNFIDFAYLI